MNFSISGIDLSLEAPRESFEPRLILDVILDRWPNAMFQDVNEENPHPLGALLESDTDIQTSEFFVYPDEASAQSWNREGLTTANTNNMVHFLIKDDPNCAGPLQITMVVDEFTPEMADWYSSLNSVLEQLRSPVNGQKKGARHLRLDAELRAAGCRLSRPQFFELIDAVRQALYPGWTQDELACHPHDAQQFCAVVRLKAEAPLPDSVIMKAMLNRRKQIRKPS